MRQPENSAIFTVSRLNQQVRSLLEKNIGRIWLNGEISNFSQPASGHWYFTLKDPVAQVRCAMFRNCNRGTGFVPRHGQQVLVYASITLYEPRGDYQIIAETMHPVGEGVLQQRYQQLKQRLYDEGLFADEHKRPLPEMVRRVGVITSASGAALHDILQILRRRDPSLPVVIYPAAVQGDASCEQLVRALELANQRKECDVLIIGRGGGSLEDLWSFNDERVVRAVFASRIPVISATGHEVDVTIVDFVADVRAPTPSAAAEIVSRDRSELTRRLISQQQRLDMARDYYLAQCRQRLNQHFQRLQQQHPQLRLVRRQTRLLSLRQRMLVAIPFCLRQENQRYQRLFQRLNQQQPDLVIQQAKARLAQQQHRLRQSLPSQLTLTGQRFAGILAQMDAVSPLATLARGYSVTRNGQGEVVRKLSQVQQGEVLNTRLSDGWLHSQLKAVTPLPAGTDPE